MNTPLRTLLISATLLLIASFSRARDTLNVEKIGEWGNFFDYPTYADYGDGILYAIGTYGIQAVDASDQTNLTPLGHYDAPIYDMNFPNFVVHQSCGYLFDANWSHDPFSKPIEVVDLANPSTPHLIATIPSPYAARSVAFSQNFMYIQDQQMGLRLIDISDPENPEEMNRLFPDSSFTSAFVVGNRGYFGSRIYDLANPREPQWLGYGRNRLHGNCFFGDSLAIATGYDGDLFILDVSDPAHCAVIDTFNQGRTQGLISYGRYMIRSGSIDDENGLEAYDLSDPANPRQVGSYHFETGWGRGLYPGPEGTFIVSGMVVFTFDEENGFQALDTLETNGSVRSTAKIGDRMIVCCGKSGVKGIDISNPRDPREVQQYDELPRGVNTLFFQDGNLLFVRGFSDGRADTMNIYDCEDVERPELLSQFVLPFPSYYSLTTEDGILTAIYSDTLYTINYDNPREPRIDQTVNLEAIVPYNFNDLAISADKFLFSISGSEYSRDSTESPVMAILNRDDPARDPIVIYGDPKSYGTSITIEGDNLFLLTHMLRNAYVRAKLTGYDISDPDNPVEIFSDSTTIDSTSQSVFIEDGHLFVWFGGYGTGRQRGYDVWDAADIRNMHYLGYTPVMGLLEDGLCYTSSGSSVQIWDFHESLSTPAEKEPETPKEFWLLTAYPNPFNSATIVSFSSPFSGMARASLVDISGREIKEWIPAYAGMMSGVPGEVRFVVDGAGLSAGTYWLKVEQGSHVASTRLVLVR